MNRVFCFCFVSAPLLTLSSFLSGKEIHVPKMFPDIQRAIDAALPGDVILVSPGVYRERIRLKEYLTLRSAGGDEKGERGLRRAEQTIIDGGGAIENESPGVTMAEGSVLDGFTITNVGKYDEAMWQKNWEEQGENQSHDEIGHFGIPGIGITGVNCRVVHSMVHHVGGTGIAIRGKEGAACYPVIAHNFCYRNMGGGIGSMDGSQALIESNTCFENFFAGIGHDRASPQVIGNECFANIRAGIGISEGACPVVRENRCYKNRRAGIGIRTGKDTQPVVLDNECFENEMAGIGVEEKAAPILRNNRCHHNKLAGIGCRDHAAPTMLENQCWENGASGIGAQGANPVLIGNRCEKNGTSGIGLDRGSDAVVIRNICIENRLVAVGLPGASRGVLLENQLQRTGGMPPLIAVLKGSSAVIAGNKIDFPGVAGVMIMGEATVIRNRIKGNGKGTGIFIQKTGSGFVGENEINGTAVPLRNLGTLRE